jgi:hypothetical protein
VASAWRILVEGRASRAGQTLVGGTRVERLLLSTGGAARIGHDLCDSAQRRRRLEAKKREMRGWRLTKRAARGAVAGRERVASCRLPVASCQLPVASCRRAGNIVSMASKPRFAPGGLVYHVMNRTRGRIDVLGQKELMALRRSRDRGRPHGEADWVSTTARRLGMEGWLRPVGRPTKAREMKVSKKAYDPFVCSLCSSLPSSGRA